MRVRGAPIKRRCDCTIFAKGSDGPSGAPRTRFFFKVSPRAQIGSHSEETVLYTGLGSSCVHGSAGAIGSTEVGSDDSSLSVMARRICVGPRFSGFSVAAEPLFEKVWDMPRDPKLVFETRGLARERMRLLKRSWPKAPINAQQSCFFVRVVAMRHPNAELLQSLCVVVHA